jgi:hypothetical protein
MYNQQMLDLAGDDIENQIAAMPLNYTSLDFCDAFAANYPTQYEEFIRLFTARGHDRPHAIQLAHTQLMHTVNDRFQHLTRKVQTISNPKGGDMSAWVRT